VLFRSKHFRPLLHPDRLYQPLHWRKPRRIAVCLMGDLFHEEVPSDFCLRIWQTMHSWPCPLHTFFILTKRPKWMRAFVKSYWSGGNIWLGVSVENQTTADERIPILLGTPAAHCWVSIEPMLGPVILRSRLDWVICGGESGPGARPMDPDWARSVRDQCRDAGVPFFMKQMSKRAPIPDDLMVREFPEGTIAAGVMS
jgi:protein gp37